jgi:hypothetical protein
MKKVFTVALAVVLFGITNSLFADSKSEKIAKLKKQISKLQNQLAELEKDSSPVIAPTKISIVKDQANIASEKLKARKKMQKDRQRYSRKQIMEIEALYQSRGYEYGSKEKTKNLKKVISKFSKANRAGCAILYLGQFSSTGKKQEYYLKKAIRKYDDCFYGDGVQVGAYASYYLAVRVYLKTGRENEAYALLKKLKEKYPNAIDHRGNNLAPQIDAICSQLKEAFDKTEK